MEVENRERERERERERDAEKCFWLESVCVKEAVSVFIIPLVIKLSFDP